MSRLPTHRLLKLRAKQVWQQEPWRPVQIGLWNLHFVLIHGAFNRHIDIGCGSSGSDFDVQHVEHLVDPGAICRKFDAERIKAAHVGRG